MALSLSFRTELRCGGLMGARTLVVTLPLKSRVPATIPASAVTVAGKAVSNVGVSGHAVTITLAPPRGMMCDSVRVGSARIVVAAAAGHRQSEVSGDVQREGGARLRDVRGPARDPLSRPGAPRVTLPCAKIRSL